MGENSHGLKDGVAAGRVERAGSEAKEIWVSEGAERVGYILC